MGAAHRLPFYAIEATTAALSAPDLKRIALRRFKNVFPDIELTTELVREVFKHAIEEHHNDETQSIQVWDGSKVCRPDVNGKLVPANGLVRINTWRTPGYRLLGEIGQDLSLLTGLLDRVFPQQQDRDLFIDWLSWNLQNESNKPGWGILLYSRRKGTGKSTICNVVQALVGDRNTMPVNGISKVTNRFNMPVVTTKLIIAEEVQLKHGSTQGNSLKTFITEKEVTTEAKGREAEKLPQCCCFLLTSNHFPGWIEAHERRYLVIDVDHDGHASGPDAAEFGEYVAGLLQSLKDERQLARLYNALMAHKQSNAFNAASLNVAAIDTPIMNRVKANSREVVLDQLEELLAAKARFAIPQGELTKIFVEDLKANPARLKHLMPELAWYPVSAKWGGVDHARVVWIHPDYAVTGGRVIGPNDYNQPVDPVAEEVEII